YLQKNYSVPCNACWTTESLNASVMEEISSFEFDVINHLVKDVDIENSCEDRDNETNEPCEWKEHGKNEESLCNDDINIDPKLEISSQYKVECENKKIKNKLLTLLLTSGQKLSLLQ
ncbi:20559_t:CDS:2, partial [Gigaspora margarita]